MESAASANIFSVKPGENLLPVNMVLPSKTCGLLQLSNHRIRQYSNYSNNFRNAVNSPKSSKDFRRKLLLKRPKQTTWLLDKNF